MKLMSKGWYKDFGQPVRVLVDCDIDTAIGCDSCVGPNIPVVFNNLAIGVAVRWWDVRVSFARSIVGYILETRMVAEVAVYTM
jgi:hypothetical protein